MTFFEAIISPFIFIIEQLFLLGFELTNNYGFAIILLSFGISLLLLPVFVFIEKAKKKDDAIKLKMQPSVDVIKRVYKGQERYYYLKTLNRQFGYNPLKALIPILSLLLQIPFFIAAYQYLESYEALKGVSFWFINDLSQADGLLGAINILPIAMTVVNLITAWFYTRGGNTSERKQMLIVAAAFLILLFNLPAGLVLYWTMNNVFSFFRLFVTNPDVFKKKEHIKKESFKSTLQKVLNVLVSSKIYGCALFLIIYFYLSGIFYFTGVNAELLSISFGLIVCIQIVSLYSIIKNFNFSNHYFKYTLLVLIAISFVAQILEISNKDGELNFILGGQPLINLIYYGFLFIAFSSPFYFAKKQIHINLKSIPNTPIHILCVLYIVGFIFLWHPMIVFASSPETFDFYAIEIIKQNISQFLVFTSALIITYFIIPKDYRNIFTYLLIGISILSIIYSFIVPINLGSLQETRFSEQQNLAAPIYTYVLEAAVLVLVGYFIWRNFHNKETKKYILFVLIIMNIFIVSLSFIKTQDMFFKVEKEKSSETINTEIPFSKDKQNVLYYIADGFQGYFMKEIMEENPELLDVFSGFVWHSNTISNSNYTHSSLSTLLGGNAFSVETQNNDSTRTISEKISEISSHFIEDVKKRGFKYNSTEMHYANLPHSLFDNYICKWENEWVQHFPNIQLEEQGNFWTLRLCENALFYSVPLFVKPKIYNNQKWLGVIDEKSGIELDKYNFVRLLPSLSHSNSEDKNFIFIHDHSMHNPWNIVKDDGNVIANTTPYKNNEWFIKKFAEWIKWMKANDVYDNTKIVLLSDHGASWYQYDGDFNKEPLADIQNPDEEKIPEKMFWRLQALLLTKDFNQNTPYKENTYLMTNGDAYSIALDGFNDSLSNPNRTLHTYFTKWVGSMVSQKVMEITNHYKVTGNIFDANNWKKVDVE